MGPSPRGMFNNSLTLYAVGQGLICSIWGDSSRFCSSGARVLNKCSSQRPQAAFVIIAMGGHGNRRRFGKGSINPMFVRGRPSQGGRNARFSSDGVISCFSLEWLSGLMQKQNVHQLLERKPSLFLKVWQQKYSLLRKGKKKKSLMNSPLFGISKGLLCWWLLFFFLIFQSS